jgi:hypothetical protein
MDPDDLVPHDCIFSMRRSIGWLNERFPGPMAALPVDRDRGMDTLVDVLQYCDAEEFVLVAVGTADPDQLQTAQVDMSYPTAELQRVPNLAHTPTVVIPGRITLDRLQGQFDQMIGQYESAGLIWAMHLQALKRTIFPEVWLNARPNEIAEVTVRADPYQGEIGMTTGGVMQEFRTAPDVQTLQTLDRIERDQRLTGGVPAEFGGESASNIRTARRGGQVLSSAIDFEIQEDQELLAASLHQEHIIGIKIAKAYWGDTKRTFYIPFGKGSVTYTPNTTFETDMHDVSYAYAGTDTAALVVEGGQRLGQGTLSKYSFMRIDPMVKDPDSEHQRIMVEMLEQAHMGSIQQQAANPQGAYPPGYLARLTELLVEERLPLYQAEAKAQAELQAQQAAQQQGQATPQEMQPGNAPMGAPGTPQAGAAIGPPNQAQMNLSDLANVLTRPRRTLTGAATVAAPPAPQQMARNRGVDTPPGTQPHGGPRAGQPGKSYPNRTDLNAQAVRTTPGQTYGAQTAQAQAQQAVPMAGAAQPAAAGSQPDLQALTANMPQPGSLGALHDPTSRPNEPLTAGLPTGAGPGPSALPTAGDPTLATLRGIYSKFPSPDILRLIQAASR